MTRKLHILNLALAALLALTGWQIRQRWLEAREREKRVLGRPPETAAPVPEPPLRAPEPLPASAYLEVAQRFLFSRDRNPDVIIEMAAPKPMPPLPVAHGILDLGSGPTAILSERSGQPQRAYRVGDRIGEFTLADVTASELAFVWEGKEIRKKLEELKPPEAPPPPEAPAPAAKPKTAVVATTTTVASGPSDIDMGGGIRACRQGDTSPPGTVMNGYKKVVTATPFGQVCRWEPVK